MLSRGGVLARVLAAPFTFEDANYQADVRRGICGVLDWLAAMPGWRVLGVTDSPIEGAEGNKEFLIAGLFSG